MYAIVDIAGQQFKVEKDKKVFVHRLNGKEGSKVELDKVLLIDNDKNVTVGAPVIAGAMVTAKILEHVKGDKVIVFKKKRRKGYKKKNGHRQLMTQIEVEDIIEKGAKPKAAEKKEPKDTDKKETAAPKQESQTSEKKEEVKAAAATTDKKETKAPEKKPAVKKETAANKENSSGTTEKKTVSLEKTKDTAETKKTAEKKTAKKPENKKPAAKKSTTAAKSSDEKKSSPKKSTEKKEAKKEE